jgi:hypothetical protein
MPKVIFTGELHDGILNGLVWEQLANGHYLSPEFNEQDAAHYLSIPGFIKVKLPSQAPIKSEKKPATNRVVKPKGDA